MTGHCQETSLPEREAGLARPGPADDGEAALSRQQVQNFDLLDRELVGPLLVLECVRRGIRQQCLLEQLHDRRCRVRGEGGET